MFHKFFSKSNLADLINRSLIITSLNIGASLIAIPTAIADTSIETEVSNEQGIDSILVASSGGSNKQVYQKTFFDQYLPQNAREMIDKIPGFSFDGGSNERGFGGNAGNVLIDGARPTSKSGGLHGALVRIPAEQVERIEILRGGVGAGEASGQAIVANVLRKTTGSSGTWALKYRRAPEGELLPNLEAAINTQLGDWKTAFDTDIGGNPGFRSALIENRDANNLLIDSSSEKLSDSGKWIFVNGEGSTEISDGLLTLNGRLGGDRYTSDTHRDIFDGRSAEDSQNVNSQSDSYWDLSEKRNFRMSEFGIDWVKTNDDWKLHLIGLGLVNDSTYQNQFNYEQLVPQDLSESSFTKDTLKTEIINRATYGYVGTNKFKPEFGVELAKNKLIGDVSYIENGVEVQIDGSEIEVTELRSEVFASFVYPVNGQLSLEGGLTGEFSKIQVSGDATNQQNFQFLKPRLSSIYKIDKTSQLTMELERKVGQLNLEGFAANVQTSDDNVQQLSVSLKPPFHQV